MSKRGLHNVLVNDVIHDSKLQKDCGDWYAYQFPRRATTTDVVCFYWPQEQFQINRFDDLEVLLVQRKGEPFKGYHCLPGGFLEIDEQVEEGAKRELFEETGVKADNLYLSGVYSNPDRDERGIISIGYYSIFLNKPELNPCENETLGAAWYDYYPYLKNKFPPIKIGFDHQKIIDDAWYNLMTRFKN